MADYVNDGQIAIDLTATYASTSAGSSTQWPANPGDTRRTNNNGAYMFVRAQSDVAAFDVVAFGAFGDSASAAATPRVVPVTTALAASLGWPMLGFAQTSIASAYYGWVALEGSRLRVNVLIGCDPKVPLYTTTTPGKLDDTTVSAGYIAGVVLNTSATSASAPYAMIMNAHTLAHA